jgi:hypothetical protein
MKPSLPSFWEFFCFVLSTASTSYEIGSQSSELFFLTLSCLNILKITWNFLLYLLCFYTIIDLFQFRSGLQFWCLCQWRAAKFKAIMLCPQGPWSRRDLYYATHAVTQGLSFSGLIWRSLPICPIRHAMGC